MVERRRGCGGRVVLSDVTTRLELNDSPAGTASTSMLDDKGEIGGSDRRSARDKRGGNG